MSPTSATRPHNPGGVARGRARCAHLSFPSATVLRVITSPGHRHTERSTRTTHRLVSSALTWPPPRYVFHERACVSPASGGVPGQCLARRWCTGVSVFYRDRWVVVWYADVSARYIFFSCRRLVLHTRTSRRRPLRLKL